MDAWRGLAAVVLFALLATACSVAPSVDIEAASGAGTQTASTPSSADTDAAATSSQSDPDSEAPTVEPESSSSAASAEDDADGGDGGDGADDTDAAEALEAERDRLAELLQEREEQLLVSALDADNPAPERPDNVPADTDSTDVWSSGPVADAEVVSLDGPTSIFGAHQLGDDTILGIGQNRVWTWTLDQPGESQSFASEIGFAANHIIIDDEWLVMSGPSGVDQGPDSTLIEFWRLDDLASGPERTESGSFVTPGGMVAIGDGVFVMSRNGTDPDSHSLWVRTMADLDNGDELLTRGYVGYLTVLQDNHVAGTGVYVFDPAEPEREGEEYLVTSGYGPAELADGRLVIGWDLSWSVIDRESGEITQLPYERLDRNFARPVATPDGRMLLNTDWGIDLYEIDDLENPVARFTPPEDAIESAIYPGPVFVTDRWMVSMSLATSNYVWDLSQPDLPAVEFGSGAPVLALRDGRMLSNSELGPVVWNPASVFAGSSSDIGRLCNVAELDDRTIVSGSASGDLLWWDWRNNPDAEPTIIANHSGEISRVLALSNNRVATASHDGTVQIFDPTSDAPATVFVYPGGAVLSMAQLDDGRLVVGGTEGTVVVFDPENPDDPPLIVFRGEGSSAMSLGALRDDRISVGIFENFLRIYDVTANAQEKKLDLEGVAFYQTVGSDGRIYVPLVHQIATFNPAAPAEPPIALPVPTASYSLPAELSDGRLVILDSTGTVRIVDPDDKAAVFASHGTVPAGSTCSIVLHDDLIAFTTGAELRIIDISPALTP